MALLHNGAIAHDTRPEGPDGLRILAFCDYFSPRGGGGAERVAREVYNRLAAQGAEITVVTTRTGNEGWRELHPNIRVVDVPTLDIRAAVGMQVSLTRGATRIAIQQARQTSPHLLHANSLEFQTSIAAARVAVRRRVPMVLTAHTAGFAHLPHPWRIAGTVHERTVGRYLLARSHLVLAVSEGVADYLGRWRGIRGRVRVVPNGVDHGAFFPSTREDPQERVHLLFVGRLIKNKGPQDLLAAVRLLLRGGLRLRMTFVGDGPMRPRLQRAVEKDPFLRGTIAFAGFTEDVPSYLRRADVLVRPSFTEGMSLAIIEAMASGLCVVASDVPGNRALIEHGRTGFLFEAGDVGDLTEVLRHALANGEERARISKAAWLRSKSYSWDRCARETLRVFLAALPGAAERASQ